MNTANKATSTVNPCPDCPTGNDGGVGVSLVNPNKIINSLTDICAKQIFTELENGIFTQDPLKPEITIPNEGINLNFTESILKLFNDSNSVNYSIQNDFLKNANASTAGASTTLSNYYLNTATKLSIARTMIHELVHAYLNVKYYNVFTQNSFDFKNVMDQYALDNGYNPNGTAQEQNRFQHEFMSQYIDAMAYSLY